MRSLGPPLQPGLENSKIDSRLFQGEKDLDSEVVVVCFTFFF